MASRRPVEWAVRVLRLFVVAAALAGCGDDDSSAVDARSGETPATIPLPTVPWSGEGEEALLVGELRWDETTGCVFAVSPEAEGEVPLVFPYGYGQLADRHALVNERDEVVAEEGDTVELAGGFHQLIDGEVVGGVITGVPCPNGEAFPVQHPIE
jgi:hypothetical protein